VDGTQTNFHNPTTGHTSQSLSQNILPTKYNLNMRGLGLDPFCVFCLTERETTTHILWDFPSASDVWSICERKFEKSCFVGPAFAVDFEHLVEFCTSRELATWLYMPKLLEGCG
jgi:hypothetical protein